MLVFIIYERNEFWTGNEMNLVGDCPHCSQSKHQTMHKKGLPCVRKSTSE